MDNERVTDNEESISKDIERYIDSNALAWAPSTIASEKRRLLAVKASLCGSAPRLWDRVRCLAPYSRLTVFVRAISFQDWRIEQGYASSNEYRTFKKKNARLFKHVYSPKKPEISYEEGIKRIKQIRNEQSVRTALYLIKTGLRYHELFTRQGGQVGEGDERVRGKGGKVRRVFGGEGNVQGRYRGRIRNSNGEREWAKYHNLYRHLNGVGLKPHDLRKIFLSRLVEQGATPFELCEIAGWSSINTASSYIQLDGQRLKDLVRRATE